MSDVLLAGATAAAAPGVNNAARSGAAPRYRREIDGLRALAILPVVLFHAGFAGFSGGFVGVDVFFVISGYLITSLVMRDVAEGRFSIWTFYERRARRILPAMIFVVLCTIPFAIWILLPPLLADFGDSVTATMGFYANHFFLDHVDYFAPRAETMPLLHMWSLAVEEQYYLFVPPLMWLLWRLGARFRLMFALIAGASLLSLIGASVLVMRYPGLAFFIFPTRAFELGIGSMLALGFHGRDLPDTRANGALGLLGIALIAAAVVLLPETAPMPSHLSLIPCLGAALVIAFATPGTTAHRVLGSRPLVGIGLISFSFYLWHQPLFALARDALGEPSPLVMGALALLSALLAVFSWYFVEQPVRHSRVSRGRILTLSAIGLIVMAALGQVVAREASRLHPVSAEDAQLAVSFKDRGRFVANAYLKLPHDFADAAPGQPKLFLIGDSYSQDFYNMSRAVGAFEGWAIATYYVPLLCQIHFGPDDVSGFLEPSARRRCAYYHTTRRIAETAREADLVVITGKFREWSAERLPASIAALNLRPEQKVIVVGPKGFGDVFLAGYVGETVAERAAERVTPIDRQVGGLAALEREFGPEQFVNLQTMLCPDGTCALFTPEGVLISHDGDHLTETGARVVGKALFQSPLLAPYLTPAE